MVDKRILVVEDDPLMQETLARILRDQRYAVELAIGVADAERRLAAERYDLVIADWKLPDGDGSLVADWAKQLGAKTALMSGHLAQMPGGRSEEHETLMKPIRMDELLALVRRSLGE